MTDCEACRWLGDVVCSWHSVYPASPHPITGAAGGRTVPGRSPGATTEEGRTPPASSGCDGPAISGPGSPVGTAIAAGGGTGKSAASRTPNFKRGQIMAADVRIQFTGSPEVAVMYRKNSTLAPYIRVNVGDFILDLLDIDQAFELADQIHDAADECHHIENGGDA